MATTPKTEPRKPQRTRAGDPALPSDFKYSSVAECEENEPAHRMHPTIWPPVNHARNSVEEPSTSGRCVLCNCHLTAYKGHGLAPGEPGHLPGIDIVLPGGARD